MKMKKVVALVAAAAMVFAMAGCGSTSDSGDADATAGSAATEEVAETDSSAAEESTSSDDGILHMATNAEFPPYESVDENGDYVGIDVEIAEAIADDLGMELEIDDIDFDSIITSVVSGKDDIGMAGMTVTDERLENVDFSDTYSTGVQVVIVTEDSEITSIDDLTALYEASPNDVLIGVQTGTTGDIYCQDDYAGSVKEYDNGATAVEALKTGKIDCVIIDNEPAKAYVEANEGLKILDTEYVTEDYAIAVAKGNDELLEKINTSLAKLTEDGTIQSIIDKYITAE